MVGAASPQLAYVGRMPTMKVDTPISRMVTRNVYLRPIMSPSRPNTSAPNGRTAKPAANASSVKMTRVFSSSGAKKFAPMIAAMTPNR